MHSDVIAAIIALVLGVLTLVNWWFVMFSDHWYADLLREQSKTWFNLGRNTESVISPAGGLFFALGGLGMIINLDDSDVSLAGKILVGGSGLFLGVAVLGLIPFRLPGPMYPEWQLERRRRRAREAELAHWRAEVEESNSSPRGRHAARPGSQDELSGDYERYGDDSYGGGSTARGDDLPVRARSPRADNDNRSSTDGPGVDGATA